MNVLNNAEREILLYFGHQPDPDYNEERLARRVLEMPNTGSEHWYTASAVTLAAAYLQLLHKTRDALAPIADAAATLEMDGIEGYPFDDPREVLWAGEGGLITVADFRRCASLAHDLKAVQSEHGTRTGEK